MCGSPFFGYGTSGACHAKSEHLQARHLAGLSRHADVWGAFGFGQSTMDKRLAGLSFLLTLGWVTAVVFVMWFFSG